MSLKGWVFVVNPASGGGSTGKNWPKTLKKFGELAREEGKQDIEDVEVRFTSGPGEASTLTRDAIMGGARVIVAVGGDGSISEVLQGFFDPATKQPHSPDCAMAILPQGTGGDFKRMLPAISDSVDSNLRALLRGQPRPVDVGSGELQEGSTEGRESNPTRSSRFFLNIASCGSSAYIAKLANESPKFWGGTLVYLGATIRGMATFSPPTLKYRRDGGEWIQVEGVNCLAICNGKYFGGGMKVGPEADISDGVFHVTLIAGCSFIDFVGLGHKLYSGDHVKETKFVSTFACRTIDIENVNAAECIVEVDGETPWAVPATFTLLPGAINIIY